MLADEFLCLFHTGPQKKTKQVVDPDRQVSDMGVLLLNNLNA